MGSKGIGRQLRKAGLRKVNERAVIDKEKGRKGLKAKRRRMGKGMGGDPKMKRR